MSSLDDNKSANGLLMLFVHTCEQFLTYPNNSLLHDGYALNDFKRFKNTCSSWIGK